MEVYMAVQINIKAKVRDQYGKGANRKLRQKGLTPAILYGNRENALPLYFDTNEFNKKTHGELHENTIFNLKIEGDPTSKDKPIIAIVKEAQFEPITDKMVHIDFYEMKTGKPVSMEVPIETIGQAIGVKVSGGILEHVQREVLIECLPRLIPDTIKVDITNLDAGEAIHIRDLQIPEGITVLEDPEKVVFTIVHAPKAATEITPEEEEVEEKAEEKAEEKTESPESKK